MISERKRKNNYGNKARIVREMVSKFLTSAFTSIDCIVS